MKKILMIITLLFSIVGLTGCNNFDAITGLFGTDKYTTYTELTYNELEQKLDSKDSFVLVIGSSTCSACAMYKQTMEKVISDKQVEIFYIALDKLSDDDYSKIYSKFVVKSTPTTIFIENGIETSTYNRIIGSVSYTEVVKSLQRQGIIGE